jgi:cell division protein FtsI (penicillin-binding protein 3)
VGKGGYADNRYTSLFAGFAPADDPRVIAVVVVNEPSRGQYYGGEVAAPVFATVVERSLQLLQVPPNAEKMLQAQLQVQKTRDAKNKKVVERKSQVKQKTGPLT